MLNNLGNSHLRRFEHTGDLQDIDHAISLHRSAVESTPSGHTDLPSQLNNLGVSYACRFQCTGNLHDIDDAISHQQSAVESTPFGHADLPSWINSLGLSYGYHFKSTGTLQDIDHSIFHHQHAVESTPPGHATLPSWFTNLGNSYAHRFQSSHYFPDIQRSIVSYRQGAEANGAPSTRLYAARHAARLSSVHDISQCLTDFALAISLLSEVAGLEQTIHRRHVNLHGRSDFVRSAVATALRLNGMDLALEWLHQGRCLAWNQFNQLRISIDNLHLRSSSLADRFLKVARALEFHGARPLSTLSPYSTFMEDIRVQDATRNHTILAGEYKQLLKEIRCLPDFHDFLKPCSATNLLSLLPSSGPVVIFNVDETRCDALALIYGIREPLHITLENFSLVQAEQLQKALQSNLLEQRDAGDGERAGHRARTNITLMEFVLKELWYKVIHPVLEALGYSVSSVEH